MKERCCGKERGERTLAGGPWEGATWLWIKNWRSRWHSRWCWELREACQPSTDYWEEPGAIWATDFYFFPWDMVPWTGQRGEGRTVCVYGCFKGHWDLNGDTKSLFLSLYNFLNKQFLSFSPISDIESYNYLAMGKANLVQGRGIPGAQGWVHLVIIHHCPPPPTPPTPAPGLFC